jgi:cytochrome c-type biogenesis protein CcmH
MTIFIAIAAFFVLAVTLLLAWPLRAHSRGLAASLIVAIPVLAFCLYRIVGTPAALDVAASKPPATMQEAIAQLEAGLRQDPQQVEGWRLLGRAYVEQQQPEKARDAFARVAVLLPDDSDAQVEYAEARAKADPQHRFDPEAVATLQRILQRDPKHQRARWFLGIAQRQAGDNVAAARTWEPLLTQVDARTAAALRPQLDAARADAGLPPLPAPAAQPAGTHAITVKVMLDPDFASRVRLRGDASVFVIARMPGGPPMPVAVEKHALQELPLTITLDDSDSPMPTQALSALQEVELVARLSTSGNAIRQDGDLESQPVRVALPAKAPVTLVLGQKTP